MGGPGPASLLERHGAMDRSINSGVPLGKAEGGFLRGRSASRMERGNAASAVVDFARTEDYPASDSEILHHVGIGPCSACVIEELCGYPPKPHASSPTRTRRFVLR